ncbi:MAG: radical SAM family heme chaperone HemW [Flavobacteriaceae bacterium]|nr:radical SAM family heme chaperone HemW [Flavobacteriaceae bacterium]MBT4112774.1 radical SAM family heme chaperone HemW [Flavobacteriaceae bacterium]MBT4613649.1 radical SAM family heme chaperone HemW [Flavobacteriaceae bacterium]MBT5246533.1 radical SAM family heme chaperone HemW [Flavobacteriaceae bacterium]MBT5649651.1 radical SAM family heme chaperone HemW [Flavobacteriaceae bacterium]
MAGIYIHIPFCNKACYYCDFHFSTSLKNKDLFITSILNEIKLRKEELTGESVNTIYFGGGTPTILEIKEINRILNAVYSNFNIVVNPEITIEANPEDLTKDKIKELSKNFNRISIGVQSFFNEDLKLMNRAHDSNQAKKSIELSKLFFNNISIDLIYGIPGLTDEKWKKNIDLALGYNLQHISAYALTVEPNTILKKLIDKGKIDNIDDGVLKRQNQIISVKLNKNKYLNYELSSFALKNYISINNSAYWQRKKYIGLGPSAHSFNGKKRIWNVSNNMKYINSLEKNKLPITIENLTEIDVYNEMVMTGLRTIWGISLDDIEKQLGGKFKNYLLDKSKVKIDKRLLVLDKKCLKITSKGRFLSDGIASDLFMLS